MSHKIGFTNDGQVFMLVLSKYEGKEFQTLLTWHPDEADGFAKDITDAAEAARGKREEILNVGNRENLS